MERLAVDRRRRKHYDYYYYLYYTTFLYASANIQQSLFGCYIANIKTIVSPPFKRTSAQA